MNRNLFPGNTEACDDFDNDCDGMTDEGVLSTFYVDSDADGFGTDDTSVASVDACSRPVGYADNADDCDDAESGVNPGNMEICDADGRDEDCNGEANPVALCACTGGAANARLDGVCSTSTQFCIDGQWGDCGIRPSAERCGDGVDNDCDGVVDDGVTIECFADLDRDGYRGGWGRGGGGLPRSGAHGLRPMPDRLYQPLAGGSERGLQRR